MKARWGVAALAAGVLGSSSHALAAETKGPAFDCAKADGTVQQLICADAALAALDRKLDGAYKAAVAKSKGQVLGTLKAEQRGWIKGRDECWKAMTETWLTESWTVKDVRSCVDGQYQLRIAELQVRWQLVPAQKSVAYGCNGNPANEVQVQLFDSALPAGRFERGDQTIVGYLVKTASGSRYESRNLAFTSQRSEANIQWLDEALKCKAK
jgi:uncharacterized protein